MSRRHLTSARLARGAGDRDYQLIASLASPAERSPTRLERHIHPVIRHFPAGGFYDGTLRRFVEQDRIGVIDVQEDLALDLQSFEGGDGAVGAAIAHMAHAAPGLLTGAGADHFVVG